MSTVRILQLPRRISDAIDNANKSVIELRTNISNVLLPVKVLLWVCIAIVSVDLARGTTVSQSFAYRMIVGAVDQLWYVVFYLSIPLLWQRGLMRFESMRSAKGWIVINDEHVWKEDEWVMVSDADFSD